MKKWSVLLIVSGMIAGCGSGKDNPVGSDLKTIREEGKVAKTMEAKAPIIVPETVVVEKPKLVVREESKIDENFFVMTADPQLIFNEGQASQYSFRARVLVPGVQIRLKAEGLPEGATLSPSDREAGLYALNWTPGYSLIPPQAQMRTFTLKIVAEPVSAPKPELLETLKNLVQEKTFSLFLFRSQEPPRDLKVVGLPQEVTEGQDPVRFSVTVKVPGLESKSAQKPVLVVSYDGLAINAGQAFREMDGSRHIVPDLQRREPEYLGDFQWRFSVVFDAKNISVQPQLGRDGRMTSGADGTRVRLSFKVFNHLGLATPETLVQMKIRYSPADSKSQAEQRKVP
ncbi:MAG: hypothetical protein ACK5Y2_02575 [Bdellovibrionales bacterium]